MSGNFQRLIIFYRARRRNFDANQLREPPILTVRGGSDVGLGSRAEMPATAD